ncbi:MAG: hypothetical protein IPP74_00910 [Alphaproteobacteria bacterium]|nr:hypothetical protein [Alphaproteobacteria bacterium]
MYGIIVVLALLQVGALAAKPVAGTNTSLPSSLTPSIRIDDDKTIGITHATVGEGTITINGEPATTDELNDLNRDVNKVQEIVKDEHNSLDIEIPIDGKTLSIAVTFIGDAAASFSDKLSTIFDQAVEQAADQNFIDSESKDEVKAVMEALKNGEITSEQIDNCDAISFNFKNLFISEAYAGGMCHILLKNGAIDVDKNNALFGDKLYKTILSTPTLGSLYVNESDIDFDNDCNADPICREVNIDASIKTLVTTALGIPIIMTGIGLLGEAGIASGGLITSEAGGALVPIGEAAFEFGSSSVVAGYEVGGTSGMVGSTYTVNIWGLYATEESQGLAALINSYKAEAIANGATKISISGSSIVNSQIANISSGVAARFGLTIEHINPTTIILTGALP